MESNSNSAIQQLLVASSTCKLQHAGLLSIIGCHGRTEQSIQHPNDFEVDEYFDELNKENYAAHEDSQLKRTVKRKLLQSIEIGTHQCNSE